jgi:HlyD family secretion protein
MKKILALLVVLLVAGLGGAYYWHAGYSDQPSFRTAPVMRGDLFIGVTATGTVEPVEIIDVGAQIVGSIKSFGPDPNRPGKTVDFRSRVKAGAVLAHLDDLPHKAELDKASANLELAEAELSRSRARQRQTERDFQRAEELKDTDSLADHENAMSQLEIAKADLAMSEAKVDQAKIARKQAEINLDYTVIRSPVDGVVIDRRVNVGQTVVAGLNAPSLFLMARDLSHMLVWSAVNEADIGDIRVGQKVTFSVDAYRDRTYSGKVSQIRLNAGLQQNVVSYGVVVDVDNSDGTLLPYMTAKLQFEVARRSDAVLAPNQALRWQPTWEQISPLAREKLKEPAPRDRSRAEPKEGDEEDEAQKVDLGTPTVWMVAEDGLVEPVALKVGLSDGMVTEITGSEIRPGSEVVVNVLREAQPDFVSSFISKVTKK